MEKNISKEMNEVMVVVSLLQDLFHTPIGPFSYGALSDHAREERERKEMQQQKEERLNILRERYINALGMLTLEEYREVKEEEVNWSYCL